MIHQIVGASCLAALRPSHDPRPALDEIASLGFNAVRGPFGGELPWVGQELHHVYEGLPRFLGWCSERGLNAIVPYITEAGRGFDLARHVGELEAIRADYIKVVLPEVGNESNHPSQGGRLTPDRCADLAASMRGPVSFGADLDDESMAYAGGAWISSHLSRSRPSWNWVRRVREQLAVAEAAGKPVISGEPMGADEQPNPGKRESDPALFLCLGALNRLFLGGNGVFHSQAGLMAERLGPNQRACAEAFIRGVNVHPGAHRLRYANAAPGRNGPFAGADFDKVVRLYAGVEANDREALCVAVGLVGSDISDCAPQWEPGWRIDAALGQMRGTDGRLAAAWRVVR